MKVVNRLFWISCGFVIASLLMLQHRIRIDVEVLEKSYIVCERVGVKIVTLDIFGNIKEETCSDGEVKVIDPVVKPD